MKPYHQMTPSERLSLRLAQNESRQNEVIMHWTVETIAEQLDRHQQRATYGAVAEVIGVLARGVMQGRTKSRRLSWIVAVNGKPTGYAEQEIHPECRRQIESRSRDFIQNGSDLRQWLAASASHP